MLNSLNITGLIGTDPSERTNTGALDLTYSKFYPVLNLSARLSERTSTTSNSNKSLSWEESAYRASVTLPYLFRKGFYNGSYSLTGFGEHIVIGDSNGARINLLDNENLTGSGFSARLSYQKATLNRELAPKYGLDLTYFYEDIKATNNDELDSYFSSVDSNIYLPGLNALHSFHINFSAEFRPRDELSYRVQDQNIDVLSYNFSRGYRYEFTPRFDKISFEYDMPLAYPNFDLWNYAFFKRITSRVFFDSTLVDFEQSARTLNSTGLELEFNTFLVRKLPVNIGIRLIHRLSGPRREDLNQAELYFTL